MLAEWRLEPDTGQRLAYRRGSLTPAGGTPDISGFAELTRLFTGSQRERAQVSFFTVLGLVALAVLVWRWGAGGNTYRLSPRHLAGTLFGLLAFVLALVALVNLGILAQNEQRSLPRDVTLLAPVQQAGSALTVEVANLADKSTALGFLRYAWPALLALVAWGFGWITGRDGSRTLGWIVGWMLLAWAALRCPNGAVIFLGVLGVYLVLQVAIPVLRKLGQMPRQPLPAAPPTADRGAAPAVTALLAGGLLWLSLTSVALGRSADSKVCATIQNPGPGRVCDPGYSH